MTNPLALALALTRSTDGELEELIDAARAYADRLEEFVEARVKVRESLGSLEEQLTMVFGNGGKAAQA